MLLDFKVRIKIAFFRDTESRRNTYFFPENCRKITFPRSNFSENERQKPPQSSGLKNIREKPSVRDKIVRQEKRKGRMKALKEIKKQKQKVEKMIGNKKRKQLQAIDKIFIKINELVMQTGNMTREPVCHPVKQ